MLHKNCYKHHKKTFFQPQSTDIILFLHKNICGYSVEVTQLCCGYTLEVPQFFTSQRHFSGVILGGDLGEIVSLSWLTSPYFELKEKWKCIECTGKFESWTKTFPWKLSQNISISESSRMTPASKEYAQHLFSWRNKKKYLLRYSYLELWKQEI